MNKYLTFLGMLIFNYGAIAQTVCTQQNRALCEEELTRIQRPEIQRLPIHEVAIEIGKHFLGTPYVAHTLEVSENEPLVIELTGLDCTTFLENVVTFSRLAKQNRSSYEDFILELEMLRYRAGERNDYPSRLHYFTEWIQDNEQKGIIKDITKEVGGIPYDKDLYFMSTHRDSYEQLAEDEHHQRIQQVEQELNNRNKYYIPKGNIQALEGNFKDGDLVAITTTIKGLDVVHVGMIKWQNGRVHLFHASSKNKKVEISNVPLADYLRGNKTQSGIIVCRLQEPL